MSPDATLRLRRATAAAAVLWALLALVLSLVGQLGASPGPEPPIRTTGLGGIVIVEWRSEEAARLGVERGDRVVLVDGEPVTRWYQRRGWEDVRADTPVRYTLVARSGEAYDIAAPPVRRDAGTGALFAPLYAASLGVGLCYFALGLLVWRVKTDRAESWAFLLFTSAMAMQLWSGFHTYDALWGYERMLMNLPFVGASSIHLFTTFPSEPPWAVRYSRLRYGPYALAAVMAGLVLVEPWLGIGPRVVPTASFLAGTGMAAVGVGILTWERLRLRGQEGAERADVVFLGALLSFAPVLLAIVANLVFRVGVPTPIALLWFVIFPVAVAYGIVRNQLFDIRGAARSSAAYGFATLAITGLFATAITFADALFSRFNVNARSPIFSVVFLFFAILAFNPLRNRLQNVADRFFDRDRANYRPAVREISEAMVSMLSLDEISDRLIIAVSDTMGVERSMVLLLDDGERALRPAAWRGDWDESALTLELPVDHPIGKQLWMRRQELARRDFDDSDDAETRETCRDVFDHLEVVLLVPILFGVDLLGVIAVGRKLSGERLGADDRQLLRTLANQSAIAIENARAFDEIAKLNETLEARVEERTHELRETQAQLMQSEKMRSLGQLVAGVAHELNTPTGAIVSAHDTLARAVARLTDLLEGDRVLADRPQLRALLTVIGDTGRVLADGSQRIDHTVQRLRAFTNLDEAEQQRLDLGEAIEHTLEVVRPELPPGVLVEASCGDLPALVGQPQAIKQVLLNLLHNALAAVGARGRIRVCADTHDGHGRIRVSDDGCGIPEAALANLFDTGFSHQGARVGAGLGLAICARVVADHRGDIAVESTEGCGTVVTLLLPAAD